MHRFLRRRLGYLLFGLSLISAPPLRSAEGLADSTSGRREAVASLQTAIDRTLSVHPDLALFPLTSRRLSAAADLAAQKPAKSLELDLEDFAGTGGASGVKSAEITLSLASSLEARNKRDARVAVAGRAIDALEMTKGKTTLDLMAEVARRYLEVVHAQALEDLAKTDVEQRSRTVTAADRRWRSGASPESSVLAAEAALARAQVQRESAAREQTSAYRRLALLWNERRPSPTRVAGDITTLPSIATEQVLAQFIEESPDLKQFADERRLREARLQLAQSARVPDVSWRLGVRRREDTKDWAAVASFSVPLGASRRAEPELRSAAAELDALVVERQSAELTLYSTLVEAHSKYVGAKAEMEQLQSQVVPRLERAVEAAERVYRAGALSYLEWAQVQADLIEARRQKLAAALDAHRALIEIQRLTAQSFVQ